MTTQAVYRTNNPPTFAEQSKVYLESGQGIYRAQKLVGDTLSLASEVAELYGRSPAPWNHAATVLNTGALGVTIPFAASKTIELGQDAVMYAKRGSALSWREGVDFLQKTALSLEMTAYSLCMLTKNSVYNFAGDIFAALEDGLDIVLEQGEFSAAKEDLEAQPTSEAKVYFTEFKKLHYVKLAKAITAFAGGILGLLCLFYGAPVIPSIALLAMSVISSSLAIFGHWYKENMTYMPSNMKYMSSEPLVRV